MRTIQCECGEFLELGNEIVVCLTCLQHYYPDKKDRQYRWHCPVCNEGFNGPFSKCPECHTYTPQEESDYAKKVFKRKPKVEIEQSEIEIEPEPIQTPINYDYLDCLREKDEVKPHVPYVYAPDTTDKPKSTFARDLLLSFICFRTGFTFTNILEYSVIKTMMKK